MALFQPECTARFYAVEISPADILSLDAYDSTTGPALEAALTEKGCDRIEFNGHFGPFIFYRIDVDDDTDARRAEIAWIIREACAP